MIKLGQKIKELRKAKNISQETLANFLGVSFQSVSKWETDTTLPDVALIPAIASFFGVSTDELFDFNLYDIEQKVMEICHKSWACRDKEPEKAEAILREGLKKYPGNDIILNNLLCVIPYPERANEVIDLCKALIDGTKYDDVKYDACRIMALAYHSIGEYSLCKEAIERIPEIYFTKLEVAADLLEGEEQFEAAVRQRSLSFESVISMCMKMGKYYAEQGDTEKARIQYTMAKNIYLSAKDDFPTKYSKNLFEAFADMLPEIENALASFPSVPSQS